MQFRVAAGLINSSPEWGGITEPISTGVPGKLVFGLLGWVRGGKECIMETSPGGATQIMPTVSIQLC